MLASTDCKTLGELGCPSEFTDKEDILTEDPGIGTSPGICLDLESVIKTYIFFTLCD